MRSTQRFSLIIFALSLFLIPEVSEAARVYLAPAASSVTVGNIVTVNAYVSTEGVAVNNGEAVIQFPTDLLQVVSVSKSASIFSLWVEEPTYSNSAGRVSFNGGITNPGYNGTAGQMVSITFRATAPGTASLLFGDTAVRANDGLGTNVLTTKTGSTLTLSNATAAPPAPPVSTRLAPLSVTSLTHADQRAWYLSTDAVLRWALPTGATTIQTGLDADPAGSPKVTYSPPISQRAIDLDEGVSYFHVRYAIGSSWSPTTHYRLQVDTTPPRTPVVHTGSVSNGTTEVRVRTADDGSGVVRYEVETEDGTVVEAKALSGDRETTISLPTLLLEGQKILVRAYDAAGNTTEIEHTISAAAAAAVNITDYPTSVRVGERVVLAGRVSRPEATVELQLALDGVTVFTRKVRADENGAFSVESPAIENPGIAVVWVQMLDETGQVAASSDKLSIAVKKPLLLQIGEYSIGLLTVLIPLVALLFLFVALLYFGWYRFFSMRARIRRDLDQLKARAHETFTKLSKEMDEELHQLEHTKRRGTAAERERLVDLRHAVDAIDAYLEKMIKKIEEVDL